MGQVTIKTGSGKTVSGTETSRVSDQPKTLTEAAVRLAVAVGTGGLSEVLRPSDKVTVKDSKGNFWTGTQK